MRRAPAALAVMAILLLSGCQSPPAEPQPVPDVLVFSSIPTGSSDTVQRAFLPIIEMLRKETGLEVRIQDSTTYEALIEGVRAGRIQLATFGPLSYVLAKRRGAQVTAVAAQTKEKEKAPGYKAYGITWGDSTITGLADLRGKTVCFVDTGSTSGYLYPADALLSNGIHPADDIKPVVAGGHEAAVLAVANRQCDAGFAYDAMVDRHLIELGQIRPGQISKIWESAIIPGAPFGISDNLPATVRERLTTAIRTKANSDYLRANGFCEGECPVGDADSYGYIEVGDNFYDTVRQVCQSTRHPSCT
jgi:phosphonate transport system substrate-binding protein